jgi:prepilin-type N-terminal cleavage/methylation domain-containing protein
VIRSIHSVTGKYRFHHSLSIPEIASLNLNSKVLHSSNPPDPCKPLRPPCPCGEKTFPFSDLSIHRNSIRPRYCNTGFTLLEIVIVLILIGLIIGGSIATLSFSSSERILRNQSGEIELLAKKARTAAILRQTPYVIEFHPGLIKLLPLSSTVNNERTTALGNAIGGRDNHEAALPELHQTLKIDSKITLTIRRWNTDSFITPFENVIPAWRFDPDGLCEPITIRLSLEESYAQDTYHPLTASVADSEFEIN